MKKTVTSTVVATAIAAAAMTSCQKENVSAPVSAGELCTIHIAENATRSAYDPATNKITLDHQELMGLYYIVPTKTDTNLYYGNDKNSIKASPLEPYTGQYQFTKPTDATNNWVGIIPYSKGLIQTNSKYTSIWCRLAPNQFPDGNSFDPHCDYLVSKPFTVEGGEGTITEFKRLFTPFRLNITGLAADDKISAVTFKIEDTPTNKTHSLIGTFYFYADSDNYSKFGFNSVEGDSMSNGVSAIYDTPLAKDADGKWPVWFIVNPITIPAGTGITVTVTTTDKTYTRTVTTSTENTITADKMNIMDFSMAEDKRNATSETIMQSFIFDKIGKSPLKLTASNGTVLDWEYTGKLSGADNDSGIVRAFQIGNDSNSFTITIPEVTGKKITKLRIYSHPLLNSKNNTKKGNVATLSLCDSDGKELGTTVFSIYSPSIDSPSITANGGYVDINLPEKQTSMGGLMLKGSKHAHIISAIVMTVVDKVESAE